MKIKQKSYKVKGANVKQGKKVDNSKLTDKEEFARPKEETNPEFTFHKPKTEAPPKNLEDFFEKVQSAEDENMGIY